MQGFAFVMSLQENSPVSIPDSGPPASYDWGCRRRWYFRHPASTWCLPQRLSPTRNLVSIIRILTPFPRSRLWGALHGACNLCPRIGMVPMDFIVTWLSWEIPSTSFRWPNWIPPVFGGTEKGGGILLGSRKDYQVQYCTQQSLTESCRDSTNMRKRASRNDAKKGGGEEACARWIVLKTVFGGWHGIHVVYRPRYLA